MDPMEKPSTLATSTASNVLVMSGGNDEQTNSKTGSEKQAESAKSGDGILSTIVDKKRTRITKSGLKDRRAALYEIVEKAKPCTVRQVYYLATVRGLVPKDERGYVMVKTDLADMREDGELPYGRHGVDVPQSPLEERSGIRRNLA